MGLQSFNLNLRPPPPSPSIQTILQHEQTVALPPRNACRVAGGSAANVAKALAHLRPAADVTFVSQVGADIAGAAYRQGLAAAGVRPLLLESGTGLPSSTCLCLVCRPRLLQPSASQPSVRVRCALCWQLGIDVRNICQEDCAGILHRSAR